MLFYTTEPEALRATLRDVFGWKHVDAGEGRLIFALPPAEPGVHPAEGGPTLEPGVRHQIEGVMPFRSVVAFVVALAACSAPAPGPEQSPDTLDTIMQAQRSEPWQDSLNARLGRLRIGIAPVVEHLDELHRSLRADSGTTRADTIFVRYSRSLDSVLYASVRVLNDSAFRRSLRPARGHGRRWAARMYDSIGVATADSLVDYLSANGIWSYLEEGDPGFGISRPALLERFGPYVTPVTTEWLRMAAREQLRPAGQDASLMIPLEELADRWAETDRYIAEHPDAPAAGLARAYHLGYMRAYLSGWDNAPAFRRSTRELVPERRESFERYVARYAGTNNAAIVAEYLDVLAANDYRRTAAVVAFLRRYLDHIADARN
jgi:hypothetical protein